MSKISMFGLNMHKCTFREGEKRKVFARDSISDDRCVQKSLPLEDGPINSLLKVF